MSRLPASDKEVGFMDHFRNIGLIGRPGNLAVADTLSHVHQFLTQRGLHVIFDEDTAALLGNTVVQCCSWAAMGEACDLVIVVGGDGSMLHAARELVRFGTPVLGINRGRLGFLTDVAPDQLDDKLGAVLSGDYVEDTRFLLAAQVRRGNERGNELLALNDIILHTGKTVHMIEFELYVEGQFVYRLRSDGLIVATPTGSTAYALSGGGPILHPRLDAIGLVPMHPHTLSSRPIVVDGSSEIKILLLSDIPPVVSADGQSGQSLTKGDWLYVRKHPFKLRLLHPPGHDFYEACRTKLGWHSHLIPD